MVEPYHEDHAALLEMLVQLEEVCNECSLRYQLAYGTLLGAVRHKGFIPWDDDVDIMVSIDHYDHFCKTLELRLPQTYCVHSAKLDNSYEELFTRIGRIDKPHHQIHVDIWPMVGTPDSELGRWFFRGACYIVYKAFFVKRVPVCVNYRNNLLKRIIARLAKVLLVPVPEMILLHLSKKLSKAFDITHSSTLYSLCGSYGKRELIAKSLLSSSARLEFEGYLLPVPSNWDGYLTQIYGDYMVPRRK